MSPPRKPTLFGLSESVYTRIARLALEEKGIEYTLRDVDVFADSGVPTAYLERHPFGRIPAFCDGDFSLYETGAITRYVDEAFDGPRLQPGTPRSRARMSQIMSFLDAYAYRPMVWEVFVERIAVPEEGGVANEQKIAAALPGIRVCLDELQRLLGDAPFLVDGTLTLADLHATPMLVYFAHTPEGKDMCASRGSLARWMARLCARPSVRRTRSMYG